MAMFVQSKALRASTRFPVPLTSFVEHCIKAFSSPLKITRPLNTRPSKYCIAATNACNSTPVCLNRSLLHNSGTNGRLERNAATEKAKEIGASTKLCLHVDEYDLDENGYLLIEELVRFLNKEGALDLCVIETSGNRRSYVDYFVVASGASTRHIKAMAKNLEQLFRGHEVRGLGQSSRIIAEGLDSDHWMVVDIGNCAVHLFLPEMRQVYELEKLWLLGPKFDDQYKAMEEEEEFLKATYTGKNLDSKENSAQDDV